MKKEQDTRKRKRKQNERGEKGMKKKRLLRMIAVISTIAIGAQIVPMTALAEERPAGEETAAERCACCGGRRGTGGDRERRGNAEGPNVKTSG